MKFAFTHWLLLQCIDAHSRVGGKENRSQDSARDRCPSKCAARIDAMHARPASPLLNDLGYALRAMRRATMNIERRFDE
jgi:hypothetical protein